MEVMVSQSYPTLGDLMDCSPPGSSVHGIFQARILEWVAVSYSRRSSQAREADSLPLAPPGNAGDEGDQGLISGWEDPLEEEMATHSSILAWKIP